MESRSIIHFTCSTVFITTIESKILNFLNIEIRILFIENFLGYYNSIILIILMLLLFLLVYFVLYK